MSGYCKWCDTVTNDIFEVFHPETKKPIWVGCQSCYNRRIKRIEKDAAIKK